MLQLLLGVFPVIETGSSPRSKRLGLAASGILSRLRGKGLGEGENDEPVVALSGL